MPKVLCISVGVMAWNSKHSIFGINQATGLMSRVFTNGPGNRGSIPGRVIQKSTLYRLS